MKNRNGSFPHIPMARAWDGNVAIGIFSLERALVPVSALTCRPEAVDSPEPGPLGFTGKIVIYDKAFPVFGSRDAGLLWECLL